MKETNLENVETLEVESGERGAESNLGQVAAMDAVVVADDAVDSVADAVDSVGAPGEQGVKANGGEGWSAALTDEGMTRLVNGLADRLCADGRLERLLEQAERRGFERAVAEARRRVSQAREAQPGVTNFLAATRRRFWEM